MDTSNFDPMFTEGIPVDSLPTKDAPISETLQQHFQGFSFVEDHYLDRGLPEDDGVGFVLPN